MVGMPVALCLVQALAGVTGLSCWSHKLPHGGSLLARGGEEKYRQLPTSQLLGQSRSPWASGQSDKLLRVSLGGRIPCNILKSQAIQREVTIQKTGFMRYGRILQ